MLQRIVALLFSGLVASASANWGPMPSDITSWNPHHPPQDNSTYANIDEIVV